MSHGFRDDPNPWGRHSIKMRLCCWRLKSCRRRCNNVGWTSWGARMRDRQLGNQRRLLTRRRVGIAAVAGGGLGLGLAVPPLAASSGYVLQQTTYEYSGNVNFCGESTIVATADNR